MVQKRSRVSKGNKMFSMKFILPRGFPSKLRKHRTFTSPSLLINQKETSDTNMIWLSYYKRKRSKWKVQEKRICGMGPSRLSLTQMTSSRIKFLSFESIVTVSPISMDITRNDHKTPTWKIWNFSSDKFWCIQW